MQARIHALTCVSLALALWGMAAPLPSAAGTPAVSPQADPRVGPHLRDDLQHRGLKLQLSPATSPIQPRQPRTAQWVQAMTGMGGPLRREVFGFAPYWELSNHGNWNYNLLSTVAYFGLDVMGDGSISTSTGGWTGWNSQDLATIITGAHLAGDAVVLVIKPYSDSTISTEKTMCQIVSSSTSVTNAIANTISAASSKGLDGVNVDFEGFVDSSCPNIQTGFTSFVSKLSTAVHGHAAGWTLTVDTYSGSAGWDQGVFNIGALSPSVDAFFVMAYDMGFSNLPGQAAPNAPLNGWTYNDTNSVGQYLTKAPASKIILGVPYYGYKWSTTSNQPYGTVQPNTSAMGDTYSGVLADLSCGAQQLSQAWDSTAQSPWVSWYSPATLDPCSGNHGSWRELYYDNAASLSNKYDLVIQTGIRGAGMWALGYDGSSPDLWQALTDKFATPVGYWMVARDGGIFNFGTINYLGSTGGMRLNQPIVGMARTPDDGGYWLVAADGGIFTFGNAHYYGSTGGIRLNRPVVGMAPTPDGRGYWLVASDGGIFTFGDAVYHGSTGALHLNKPVVGMASTSTGQGYWLVASDGGIFTFGDAGYHGSTGGLRLNQPVVGMAPTSTGQGYWLVASDGGIFTYGDARYFGSTGSIHLNQPIVGMAATRDDGGYRFVASDGGIFDFGVARYFGSMASTHLNQPIVGMAGG